jgi:hypothetical protein
MPRRSRPYRGRTRGDPRVLNQAVKRNRERFPADFMFRLSAKELEAWRSHVVMSNPGARMGLRRAPFAFTEHGALMAATVLNSARAVEVSLYVVRAFVRLGETLAAHKDLASKLHVLEKKTEALALRHDGFVASTRLQLRRTRSGFLQKRSELTLERARPKRQRGEIFQRLQRAHEILGRDARLLQHAGERAGFQLAVIGHNAPVRAATHHDVAAALTRHRKAQAFQGAHHLRPGNAGQLRHALRCETS